MQIDEKLIKQVTLLGTLGFNVQKVINILEIKPEDVSWFIGEFNNPFSPLRKAYDTGADKSDFAITKKLFEQAQTGDLKAIEIYNAFKEKNASTIDAQDYELKQIMVEAEKRKLYNERSVDCMINEFLGYGNGE